MDITTEYILMCEKAEEIQNLRKIGQPFLIGDYFEAEGFRNSESVGRHVIIAYNDSLLKEDIRTSDCIWLPRQDQLQEMLFEGSYGLIEMVEGFYNWFKRDVPHGPVFIGFEECWLAFVMKKKYNKVWNGKEWIKEEEHE